MSTHTIDKEYKGLDIIIQEHDNGYYTSNVKRKNGEFIWGWQLVPDFNLAMMKAVDFIDLMPSRGWII